MQIAIEAHFSSLFWVYSCKLYFVWCEDTFRVCDCLRVGETQTPIQ